VKKSPLAGICTGSSSTLYTLAILCGGQGSRMGGADKGLLSCGDNSFVEAAISRFRQADMPIGSVIISANRNQSCYQGLGARVVKDQRQGYLGPLAGLEAVLSLASPQMPLLLIPCDMPGLPDDLASRLVESLSGQPADTIVIANDGERAQPLCMALYPSAFRQSLSAFLDSGGRGVFQWLKQHHVVEVNYSGRRHCFNNINDGSAYLAHFGYDPRNESISSCKIATTP